jgi:hemerythrin
MDSEDIVWDETLEIGITEIDTQHKHLFSLLGSTQAILDLGEEQTSQGIKELFRELMDYAVYHFDSEESLMRNNNFQGLPEHLIAHENFKNRIKELIAKWIKDGNVIASKDITFFIKTWFINHVRVVDSQLRIFAPPMTTTSKVS